MEKAESRLSTFEEGFSSNDLRVRVGAVASSFFIRSIDWLDVYVYVYVDLRVLVGDSSCVTNERLG